VNSLRQRAFVPVLLCASSTAAIVSSLGAPLIPRLAEQLHVSISSAQWTLTVTLVVGAVLSPLVGQLGDGRHRVRVLQVGLGAVFAGGVMAAVTSSLPWVIAGRAIQGFGIALMPLTMAAARDRLPKERAARVVAGLSVVGAAGVGLGYPLTGLIADNGGVAAAYWFGGVAGLAALVLVTWAVPAPTNARVGDRVDLLGAMLIALGLVALLLALDRGADWGWGSARTGSLIAIGLVVIAIWTVHELRVAHPLVDLRLLRHRGVLGANLSALLLGVTFYASLVTVTQLVQQPTFGFGASVLVSGLTLLPLSVLSAAASRTLPWLERRIGTRPIIPAGAIAAAGASVFFALTANSLWQAFATMGITGIAFGYTFAAIPGLVMSAVPRTSTSSAMGLYQVTRFVGFATGSGMAVTLLRIFGRHGEPTLHAYRATNLTAAGIALFTAGTVWLLTGPVARGDDSADAHAFELRDGLLATAGLEDIPES
jgi:MFS family permease